jgi:hypothetical protein
VAAKAVRVSADELLGLKATREKVSPGIARLRKRLRHVETLPPEDQKSVLKLVDLLVPSQRIKRPLKKKPSPGGTHGYPISNRVRRGILRASSAEVS